MKLKPIYFDGSWFLSKPGPYNRPITKRFSAKPTKRQIRQWNRASKTLHTHESKEVHPANMSDASFLSWLGRHNKKQ